MRLFIFIAVSVCVNISFAQSTFTTFISGASNSCSPISVIQLRDSTYCIYTTCNPQGVIEDYNTIIGSGKHGNFKTESTLALCLNGNGHTQMKGVTRNYFLLIQQQDYCDKSTKLQKLDSIGNAVFEKNIDGAESYPEYINNDTFGIIRNGSFVLYSPSGDSIAVYLNKKYNNIQKQSDGSYIARDENSWVKLNSSFIEIARVEDLQTGFKGNISSYQTLSNGAIVALTFDSCIYYGSIYGWRCIYSISYFDKQFSFTKSDSITVAPKSIKTDIRLLSDGGFLASISADEKVNIYKFWDGKLMYSFSVNSDEVYKYFNIRGGQYLLKDAIQTNDAGVLLLISKYAGEGSFIWSTMLMKFDSLGNFYWPFATGEHELQNIQHRVYPNPTTNQVNYELHEGGDFEITVTDVNGKRIYKVAAQANATINTSNWSNGIYFYTISNNQKVAKGKIIKY